MKMPDFGLLQKTKVEKWRIVLSIAVIILLHDTTETKPTSGSYPVDKRAGKQR